MADSSLDSLESFEALHTELIALSQQQYSNVERLDGLLRAHLQAFQALLDTKPRSEASRKSVESGKLDISQADDDGVTTYAINAEFQQGALQLADELKIDEIDAATLFWAGQEYAEATGRSIGLESIVRFHQRRAYLLHSLRLLLGLEFEDDVVDEVKDQFSDSIQTLLKSKDAKATRLTTRCIKAMESLRTWLRELATKASSFSVLGLDNRTSEQAEMLEFQRVNLVEQHECLGVILELLIKHQQLHESDFESVIAVLKGSERYDNLLAHQFPAFGAYVSHYASPEHNPSMDSAKGLYSALFRQAEDARRTEHEPQHVVQDPWQLNYVYAACRAWWLAEYSGYFGDHGPLSDATEEMERCSTQYAEALKDGAFDFLLCLSADVKSTDWTDPARHGLRVWLVRKPMSGHAIVPDTVPFSAAFQDKLMEVLETHVESFISNLPNVLRKLRNDEDEQRQQSREHDHDLDLERFVVIISYAFEDRPIAAFEAFWDVPDGAFYGFLHWASKRASTPLVSAFCEMLQALSCNQECADAAHAFLKDEVTQSGRIRRSLALSWEQILKELTFFTCKIRDQAIPQPTAYRGGKSYPDSAELEPESTLMLESYLRLITKLCQQSQNARLFMKEHPRYQLMDILFQLASSSIPSRLRACAFTTMRSLLTQASTSFQSTLWHILDAWIRGGQIPGVASMKALGQQSMVVPSAPEAILRQFCTGFEEPYALVCLLQQLLSPPVDASPLHNRLPYPEGLGASQRSRGIEPYVDYVLGTVFSSRYADEMEVTQLRMLRLACLQFVTISLDSFNEDLLVFANVTNTNIDAAMPLDLEHYITLHQFARVMEWMFNSNAMVTLFGILQQDLNELVDAAQDSPLVLCLVEAIRVIAKILRLQATYLEVVRPVIKIRRGSRVTNVANPAFSCFEDGILNYMHIISDLGLYCGSPHKEVAIASLDLLRVLCSSPKITTTAESGRGLRRGRNRVISAIELSGATEGIRRMLIAQMDTEVDALQGMESHTYRVKVGVLDVLMTCLQSSPNTPSVAHLLLGFDCDNDTIAQPSDPDVAFNHGVSLLHSILIIALKLPLDEPVDDTSTVPLWSVSLSLKCMQVLAQLWLSPLSSSLVLDIMEANQAVFDIWAKQLPMSGTILWDGFDPTHDDFLASTASECLSIYMLHRSVSLDYAAAELRHCTSNKRPTMRKQTLECLLGVSNHDQDSLQKVSVFDLLEFTNISFPQASPPESLSWHRDLDMSVCLEHISTTDVVYNVDKVDELLALYKAELTQNGQLDNPQDKQSFEVEVERILQQCVMFNHCVHFWSARLVLLKSWARLMAVVVQSGESDNTGDHTVTLQTLQLVVPCFEKNLDRPTEIEELARLIQVAVAALKSKGLATQSNVGQLMSDKLLQIFDTALRSSVILNAYPLVKEVLYGIAIQYLNLTWSAANSTVFARSKPRSASLTIKAIGDRLAEVVCDDALAGEPGCRISALLLLECLVEQGRHDDSTYMLDSMVRLNFITLLVQTISHIRNEMGLAGRNGVDRMGRSGTDRHLADVNAQLSLLLTISRTRSGASAVVNAGLFHTIKKSGAFSVDWELELDPENARALAQHFNMLTSLLRIVLAVTLTRGIENEYVISTGRQFLSDNRNCVLAVLKQASGRTNSYASDAQARRGHNGVVSDGDGHVALKETHDLADAFMCLISAVGFLEFEEQVIPRNVKTTAFT